MKARIRANGFDPRAQIISAKAVLTLDELWTNHFAPYKEPRIRSFARYEQIYRIYIRPKFGHLRLGQVSRLLILAAQTELLAKGLSPASCDHFIKLTKVIFNYAIFIGVFEGVNPGKVPLFNADNRVENLLSDEELQRLIYVLRNDSNRPVCSILLFLLSTGARLNEALQATWSQIDIQSRTWTIPATNSKSKRSRAVPLTDSAIDVLSQLDTQLEFAHLFINRKTGNPYINLSKPWRRLQGLAKLSKSMRVHDLRHTTAQLMAAAGRTLLEIQMVLGHAHYSTTSRYARLSMAKIFESANVISLSIGSANKATSCASEMQQEVREAA